MIATGDLRIGPVLWTVKIKRGRLGPKIQIFTIWFELQTNGARIINAMNNWDKIPNSVNREIDQLSNSIKPPLRDEEFDTKIRSIGDQYKANLHRTVNQHLIRKYTETCRRLAVMDDTDMGMARQIARKQIIKYN